MKKILDACCGSRMFWFDKQNPNVTFMDIRRHYEELETGHVVDVNPDIVGDFRDMPFESDTFDMVVFDPPHLIHAGDNSWLAKKYGKLDELWPEDIRQGFAECMRVLKPNGSLIFKWNEDQISLQDVLAAIGEEPLFGNKRSKTHWLVFMK
nr:MAG TPA: Methyltransferase domain [Caudoviricetes sp.]